MNKHHVDHWTMQLISKHFYLERVFDDSSIDQPKLQWRYRTFFGDQIIHPQRTSDDNTGNGTSDSDGANWEDTDEPEQVYVVS